MIFRRMLGMRLIREREQRGLSQKDVAKRLHRDASMVARVETATSLIDGLALETLCTHYGLDESTTKYLFQLRELASQPPWWTHLGRQIESTEALLLLEQHAHRIRNYDQHAIPGLLQTPAYAKAINAIVDDNPSDDQLDRDVALRMERQQKVWGSGKSREATFIVDEAVLRRMPGNAEAQRTQLASLLAPASTATIQVLPFSSGPSPSIASYNIFDLDLGAPAKGVHVDGSAAQQGVVAEENEQVALYELVFERTRALALSPAESARMVQDIMRSIKDD